MGLRAALKEKLFDTRLRDKLLADGLLTQEELARYLEQLEDDSSVGAMVELSTPRRSVPTIG